MITLNDHIDIHFSSKIHDIVFPSIPWTIRQILYMNMCDPVDARVGFDVGTRIIMGLQSL